LRDVAKSLGVSQQTLRNWCNRVDVDAGRRTGESHLLFCALLGGCAFFFFQAHVFLG
jgi:transposase-like protein